MGGVIPVEFPVVPGLDVAAFVVGDEVLGSTASGSYAEQALASVNTITTKPTEVPWQVAAGLPVAATTYRALALLDLTAGETIVIDGAAGGVGTVAVQVARHRGPTVIGTASHRNHDYLRSLGAIPVTYGGGIADRTRAIAPQGVDAALDASGRGSLPDLIDLTGGPGRLAAAVTLVAAGTITLPITRTYPLSDAATAHRDSQAGHVRGKLVLLPG
jgi:NADPH:quinone reductase-like Zn-dependent oxidoreductase